MNSMWLNANYSNILMMLIFMQIASSFLSNLLEVIEEVQLARIEIRNLVQAKFYSQSGDNFFLYSFHVIMWAF